MDSHLRLEWSKQRDEIQDLGGRHEALEGMEIKSWVMLKALEQYINPILLR